ncbi:MAG TPA: SMP-30/gluconolactonase/LRE family protein [Pyrinomonadaceae bacterium]|nr:SMP-30/gluconolactonase/LRE family protein [Pyrinomonadaceae bacterium]
MSVIKRILLIIVLIIAFGLAYLLFWPVPIAPVAWTPPTAPGLTGIYQQNQRLAGTERLSLGAGFAPEGVAIDAQQRIYGGLDDGRIMRLHSDGTRPELFADTKGRPLGLKFDSFGNLIVADAVKGLLLVSRDGVVSVLTSEAEGVRVGIANTVDIAADGTIYFSDASTRFPLTNYKADILEHQSTGRLLAYNPLTRTTRLVLGGLSFANGVALSPDQSFVLVNETGKYRIHRVWLNGADSGKSEIFIDNLPGFPDGISSNGKDRFWLALVTPRDATLDRLLPYPFLRKAVWRLPPFLRPAPKRYSFVLGLDTKGQVVENLQNGASDCYAQIANAVEHEGFLYFGSIGEAAIGRYRLTN